jgi:hypothetical protein
MRDSIPHEISRLHLSEFKTAVKELANDRDALVAIKGAIETEISSLQDKPHIRKFYVMKNIHLDGLIRQIKTTKKSSLQNPAGTSALVVVVKWIDDTGETVEDQIATMGSMTELMSKLWAKARANGDDFPQVASYWTCHDLSAIPQDIQDDTFPVNNDMENIADEPQGQLHENFSR